ncbi:MAG TPA: DEAD/DEAH box helicase, partial [Gammaproteobacteria bacterium]|nr:DEAD/DEAH box helicase [Gammaproteobacteria bacterium]
VAGQAQTGTGKTAAFLLAVMNRLLRSGEGRGRRPRALILAPTRELAIQIHKDAQQLGKHTNLSLGLAYGGSGYEKQRKQISEGVDILIGTPGRLIDYFKQRVFNLKAIEVLVLDEADRMFDLGFIKDIRFLLRRMPPPERRQSLLFSATLSLRVTELAYEHMNNPQVVRIDAEQVTASKVRESVYYPANTEKIPLLLGLLKSLRPLRSIVFVNTKRAAEEVWGYLEGNGFHAAVLSGDVPQKKRIALLRRFQEGELSIMVATDVAARGLHIENISHVFNYDLPQDEQDYVHRIGRTARAGASGEAISFACERYAFSLMDIEAYIGHRIPMREIDADLLVTPEQPVRRRRRPAQSKPASRQRGRARSRRRSGRRAAHAGGASG